METFDPRPGISAPELTDEPSDQPRDRAIAALEARVRALEYVINNLPEVTAEVLHKATQDVGMRHPSHPLESNATTEPGRIELAERALTELWRQKK